MGDASPQDGVLTVAGDDMSRITHTLAVWAALTPVLAGSAAAQLAPPPMMRPEPPPAFKQIDPGPAATDWASYNYDRERSGWNRGETLLTKQTVGKLKPLWNKQLLSNTPALVLSTLTAPVVAGS